MHGVIACENLHVVFQVQHSGADLGICEGGGKLCKQLSWRSGGMLP